MEQKKEIQQETKQISTTTTEPRRDDTILHIELDNKGINNKFKPMSQKGKDKILELLKKSAIDFSDNEIQKEKFIEISIDMMK